MSQFLSSHTSEQETLLRAVSNFEGVWTRFQEHRQLDVGQESPDSLIASELSLVRDELQAQRFTIGLFGLIKRGKSTLLNSMLGQEVSAMHVTPETAVPVHVEYGETPAAWVHLADGQVIQVTAGEIPQFTSQKHNPNNEQGVLFVHQRVPVEFLRHGAALIDTPGLDDAQADEIYTERTLQELESADAGVIVFLSPPTVGATELGFLEQVASSNLKKTFLVCNMYPQHFHDPDTRKAVLTYVANRIAEAARRGGRRGKVRIYPVCALDAWEAVEAGDMAAWRKSGVERLHRDLEVYLRENASKQVLVDAAQRVAHVAELAKADVEVRSKLLEDPRKLAEMKAEVDEQVGELHEEFDTEVATTLARVEPLRTRSRSMLLQPFIQAKRSVANCRTPEEIETFTRRFRRELEVASDLAARHFSQGFASLVSELRVSLEQRFSAVMGDFTTTAPRIALSQNMMLINRDQLASQRAQQDVNFRTAIGGAAAGGLSIGFGLSVTGALLGPVGLIAGALVGWKLSTVMTTGRAVDRTRDVLLSRLDEVAREVTREFDEQVAGQLDRVRTAVKSHRRSFAADIYQQFAVAEAMINDEAALATFQQEADQFRSAFDECAAAAWRATNTDETAPDG